MIFFSYFYKNEKMQLKVTKVIMTNKSFQPSFYIITRDPPKRGIANDYSKYRNKVDERRRNNSALYSNIENLLFTQLKGITQKKICQMADYIAKQGGLNVDRQAKRLRQSMICWFCENWELASRYLAEAYVMFCLPGGECIQPQAMNQIHVPVESNESEPAS